MKYLYRSTECTFLQFLSAFIASAQFHPEPIVLTVVDNLILQHEDDDNYAPALIEGVLKYSGNQCVMVKP